MNNNKKYRLTLLDYVNVCLQTLGDHVMHAVIVPRKPIDLPRFRRALRLSVDAEPILGCRLVYSRWKPHWTPWDDATLDAHDWCDLQTAGNVDQQVENFLHEPMDCRMQPMVRACLIRGETDTLCLNINCVPIDGRGMAIYLERLFDIYNRLARNPRYEPVSVGMDLRTTRHLVQYFRWYHVFALLFSGLRNQLTDRSTAHNWRFPSATDAPLDRAFHYHCFSPKTLAAMTAFRQPLGFSFNDLVLAAYYEALYRVIQPARDNSFCVMNTYDLRRYESSDAPARVANYSSFVNSNVAMEKGMSFRTLVERVRAAMAERKRHFPGITEGPFIWPLFQFLPFGFARWAVEKLMQRRGEDVPVMTNVGVVDLEQLRLDGEMIRSLIPHAPLMYPPKLAVTVATVGDRVTFSVGYSRNHIPQAVVEQLFRRMEQVLIELTLPAASKQEIAA